jgi:molybdopterin molybdotransferase
MGMTEPAGTGMDPVEVHLADVLAAVHPLGAERVALADADGAVLAEDATAASPLPPFDNSAMDGYAVHASDTAAASAAAPAVLPVTDEIPAGDTRVLTVPPGICVRIMTGALMPVGADAVVPVEWTDGGREQASIRRPAPKGHAIRRRGDDVNQGDVLLPAGTRLGPAQIGVLAAGGHGTVQVRPQPRVAVIGTGNELTGPGEPLEPGRIWDSNTFMLAAAVRQAGGIATRIRIADEPEAVLSTLGKYAASEDLLITSGGVSMGAEHDVVKAALAGYTDVTFRKVAMQPGMPQGFGRVGPRQAPVFMLPGNPVSAFVSFHLFVRPALNALRGLPTGQLPTVRAALTRPARSPEGKRSFLRGVLEQPAGTVTPLTGQGSHQLGALARANALIVVPEDVTQMEQGETVTVWSLP